MIKNYRYCIIEKVNINKRQYYITDIISNDGKIKRSLSFEVEEKDFRYLASSVYLDNSIEQPIYIAPQRIIGFFINLFQISAALVLGTAGCTIPRFLIQLDDEISVFGVELSGEMIEIAKKYFWIDKFDERFHLVKEDAFKYVQSEVETKYGLVFVDIFVEEKVPESLFDISFIRSLDAITASDSLILFNLLDLESDKVAELIQIVLKTGVSCKAFVLNSAGRKYIILLKTKKNQIIDSFRTMLNCIGNVWEA